MTQASEDDERRLASAGERWFALHVRSNCENLVLAHLRERGYAEFCPSFTTTRQWSDRKKVIRRFLFPGYIFCRLDLRDRLPVLKLPGVIGFVGSRNQPTPIPDGEIASVRTMAESGLGAKPWPFLSAGQTILIERGPLAGLEGILQQEKNTWCLVVTVQLLKRSISVQIDRSWVRPVTARRLRWHLAPEPRLSP